MKLQISFDLTDLDKAVAVADQVAPYVSILEVGSLEKHFKTKPFSLMQKSWTVPKIW